MTAPGQPKSVRPLRAAARHRHARPQPAAVAAIVTCVALASATATVADSPLQLSARAEPRETTIGTPFRYTMTVEAAADVEVLVPLLSDSIGEFIITDFGEAEPKADEDGNVVVERWYTLVSYRTGELLVPGASVQYREPGAELATDYFPDAPVTLTSLLAAAPAAGGTAVAPELRPIKGPRPAPLGQGWFWMALAACATLAALATALWWWSQRVRRESIAPPRPAHEIALEALAELESGGLLERGKHEQYYVELSSVVRDYIEARFELRAPEMTTDEFLAAAQRDGRLAVRDRTALQRFLQEADLVKFARHVPERSAAEHALNAARNFVEHTALIAAGQGPETERAVA